MPTPILMRRVALVASFGLPLLGGCTDLRPLGERADGSVSDDGSSSSDGSTASDAGCDGAACGCTPTLSSSSLSVVAHGAHLTLDGTCLGSVDSVTIGGVAQTFQVASDTSIVVASVSEAAPTGASVPIVASVGSSNTSLTRPVVHLVIDELDSSADNGMERHQYVEISTSVNAALDLSGYQLVFADGADDGVHDSPVGIVLGTTTATGRYLVGNPLVAGTQATVPVDSLTASADVRAVVLAQGSTLPSPTDLLASIPGPILDSLVYTATTRADDVGLLAVCYPDPVMRLQTNEDVHAAAKTESIRRCATARRSGAVWSVGAPAPGAPNVCP